jgi:cytochrome c-type biogenesis protein CcsB
VTPTFATFAEISNNLVYSSIAVYVGAMLAYAAETAARVAHSHQARHHLALAGNSGASVSAPWGSEGTLPKSTLPGRSSRAGAVGTSLMILGLCLNVAAVASRGIAAQRAPWGNMYEFALVGAVTASAAYLAFLRTRPVRDLGVWIVAIILLALGMAVTVLYTPADALVPVLNSYWLVVHVAAAIIAGGVFTLGAVATALFLVRSRSHPHANATSVLQQVSHTAHMFAFPIWTFAVLAGAVWAENSWGRYWGWDPKETWAFITWVLYAAYLHAQATTGWRGAKASWFALAGYAAFLFNFFGVNMWIPGLHSYAGV